jgi:hypothetical protein
MAEKGLGRLLAEQLKGFARELVAKNFIPSLWPIIAICELWQTTLAYRHTGIPTMPSGLFIGFLCDFLSNGLC